MIIRYIHIRDHDDEGELMSTGGATVAYRINRISDQLTVQWSMAECLPWGFRGGDGDRFVKSLGREISMARLLADKVDGTIMIGADQEFRVEETVYLSYLERKKKFFPEVVKCYYPIKRSFCLHRANPAAVLGVKDPEYALAALSEESQYNVGE